MAGRPRVVIAAAVVLALAGFTVAGVGMLAVRRVVAFAGVDAPSELDTGPQSTVVFDRHGRAAFAFHVEDRTDVPLHRIAPSIVDAVIAVEDKRFFGHTGLDPIRMVRAAIRNIGERRIVEGGSTVTQQLARLIALDRRRTFTRKAREVFLAARLEQTHSKRDILEAYLNKVYFGSGYYGVEAASRGYFGKSAREVDVAEAALLAALIKSPVRYSPRHAPALAKSRRNLVLGLMARQHRIDEATYRRAEAMAVSVRPDESFDHPAGSETPSAEPCGLYFKEELRRVLMARFGADRLYGGGLRVFATMDAELQCEAERAIGRRLKQLTRTPRLARGAPGASSEVRPHPQGGLVSIDPRTGEVLALVGGRDFHETHFNRATQARRQPGSAFKPFIFAAALERGYLPASVLTGLDTPIDADSGAARADLWLPAGDHEAAAYTLRRALTVSSNRASARLLQIIGVQQAIDVARRIGIESALPAVPSLALGVGEVTLLELTAAYGTFANRGNYTPPVLIRRVEDRQGNVIWEAPRLDRRALSEATAFLVTNILADAVDRGTASTARAAGFKLPAAGKTGTTDDFGDAWFVGYTPKLVTGVWFGYDRRQPIARRGFASVIAVPAWADFMKAATRGEQPDGFVRPPDVERVAICSLSGELAGDGCRHAAAVGTIGTISDDGMPIVETPASQIVYDYAPVGALGLQPCSRHSAWVEPAAVPEPVAVSAPATTPATDSTIVIERVTGADGVTRTVLRQRSSGG